MVRYVSFTLTEAVRKFLFFYQMWGDFFLVQCVLNAHLA